MDRVKTIMERLGFNEAAADDTKAAFIQNLIKQAYGVDVPVPVQYHPLRPPPQIEDLSADVFAGRPLPTEPRREVQMSFDFAAFEDSSFPQLSRKGEPPKVG